MKSLLLCLCVMFTLPSYATEITHELGTTTLAKTPKKIVTLDWALTESVLALGVNPVGIADIKGYRQWVEFPEIPDGITDVGNRYEPNFELLKEINPDVILISKHLSGAYEQLNTIAPTIAISVYNDKKTPLESAKNMLSQLGNILNKQDIAQQEIADADAVFKRNGELIQSKDKALLFVRLLSTRSIRVHSKGSLIHDTITSMGLENAWQDKTNLWGFTKAGIDKLVQHQNARIILLGPLSDKNRQKLEESTLWQAMKFTKENRVYLLDPIWTFGGLIAAKRFSDHIKDALLKADNQ